MDSTVWIALIIAAAVIVILFMFRPALKKFFLRADQGGIEAGIETREVPAAQPSTDATPNQAHAIEISHNKLMGAKQKISVGRSDVKVSDNTQIGHNQAIEVKPPQVEE